MKTQLQLYAIHMYYKNS